VARRIGAPYPALVALAGAALALIPGVPTLVLDPELALALFVAPVLLDAAFDSSPRDLRANWRPIASLALGAVALTIIVVAVVAHALVPGMPVAGRDRVRRDRRPAGRRRRHPRCSSSIRPPHRLLVILEGESLFNDASALLSTASRSARRSPGFLSGWSVIPTLLVVTLGSGRARARASRGSRS
jgi:CPA1 family monovalent cation:H+ antiporter